MQVNISCKTGETSLASAAAVHLAAVAPALAWGLTVTSSGLAEDVTAAPLRVDAGHVEVPERPGLGIDVDEHRLRRRQQEFKAASPQRMIPKSGNRFSDKIMRKNVKRMIPKSGNRFSDKIMRKDAKQNNEMR